MKQPKLVSYCLFAFNNEKYIKHAIKAALRQTYSPLEIIISDDCSTDSTYDIVNREVKDYVGPHLIKINKNSSNMGIGRHVSKICYELARGKYIIQIAGDDISYDNHVESAVRCIENNPETHIIDFNAEIIDEHGKVIQKLVYEGQGKRYSLEDYLNLVKIPSFAPGRIIKKELLDHFDPITINCPTEDSVFVLRSLLLGGIFRSDQKVVSYRKHEMNISNPNRIRSLSSFSISAQYILDLIRIFKDGDISENQALKIYRRIYYENRRREIGNVKGHSVNIWILKKLILLTHKFQYKLEQFLDASRG